MTNEKYIAIFDNYKNGNISTFKDQIRKLRKLELLEFLDQVGDLYGYGYLIRKCKKFLSE
jgi:hypothetical protein